MIDFGLAPEQDALQQSARQFLAKECPPLLVRDCMPVDDGAWPNDYMFALGLIIGGGTAQVQKNIIAERGLGLPREPRPS